MSAKVYAVLLSCLFVIVVVAVCISPAISEAHAAPPEVPVLEERVVGKLQSEFDVQYIVQIEGTDALYIQTTRYHDLVPYLDGDGTPVTCEEFLVRVSQ